MDRPRSRSRWLRRLFLPSLLFALLIIEVPTLESSWIRYRVLSAVYAARSVRLEEFGDDGKVLTAVELDPKQRDAVAYALPVVPDIGIPGMMAMCFIPHHRIVARDSEGGKFVFQVCFACGEVQAQDGGIFMTPVFWRVPLRQLFTSHKIPIRTAREYYNLVLRRRESKRKDSD